MDLEVDRGELATMRQWDGPVVDLGAGDARVRIDAFGLSSNNISYAVFGDLLRYWEFFPGAPAEAGTEEQWGRIPVWGFGDVVESRSPAVAVGERLYGYFPMSTELVLTPGRSDDRGISDVAPHRAEMAGAYSRYVRCASDPRYRADREAHQMLLFPLFYTSFVVDDFFVDRHDIGAEQVVVSSASSKTAIGVAFQGHERGMRMVGLTSASNLDFVASLGVYDAVLTYDDVASLDVVPSVFADIAGNRDVRSAVHHRLDGVLAHSMTVGGTHWDHATSAEADAEALPNPTPEFFFAPTQIAKRTKEWGRAEVEARVGGAWDRYVTWVDSWVDFRRARGAAATSAVYRELLAGSPDPRVGHLCTLVENEATPS